MRSPYPRSQLVGHDSWARSNRRQRKDKKGLALLLRHEVPHLPTYSMVPSTTLGQEQEGPKRDVPRSTDNAPIRARLLLLSD